jgi:hypothetical protein
MKYQTMEKKDPKLVAAYEKVRGGRGVLGATPLVGERLAGRDGGCPSAREGGLRLAGPWGRGRRGEARRGASRNPRPHPHPRANRPASRAPPPSACSRTAPAPPSSPLLKR